MVSSHAMAVLAVAMMLLAQLGRSGPAEDLGLSAVNLANLENDDDGSGDDVDGVCYDDNVVDDDNDHDDDGVTMMSIIALML